MKVKVYIRVGYDADRRRHHVQANVKPNARPLENSQGPLPTVAFGITLDLPDRMFKQAEEIIAELRIPEEAAVIAAEVIQ